MVHSEHVGTLNKPFVIAMYIDSQKGEGLHLLQEAEGDYAPGSLP